MIHPTLTIFVLANVQVLGELLHRLGSPPLLRSMPKIPVLCHHAFGLFTCRQTNYFVITLE